VGDYAGLLCVCLQLCWDRDYGIGSNFPKFYLIRRSFTAGEAVFLVKVFRVFELEQICLVFRVWT
jgi:hypothetical protein